MWRNLLPPSLVFLLGSIYEKREKEERKKKERVFDASHTCPLYSSLFMI
jgi:hypothetical protein